MSMIHAITYPVLDFSKKQLITFNSSKRYTVPAGAHGFIMGDFNSVSGGSGSAAVSIFINGMRVATAVHQQSQFNTTQGVSAPVSEGDVVSYDGTFLTAHNINFIPYK